MPSAGQRFSTVYGASLRPPLPSRYAHLSLHRHGDERAWWTNLQISPLPIANALLDASPVHLMNGANVAAATGSEARGQ
ncbi:hypothetical protein BSZ22_20335 [Bradyrhizobium canariense]|nr:hypothetical protein BSZ22_20335 [Bradyrhizobium canariense]OSI89683.1 hypothetical protein BSZ25_20805 [Bradyrhizobium canariense]